MLGATGVELKYGKFFVSKTKPKCSFRFQFKDENQTLGIGTLFPGVPFVQALKFSSPVIILTNAATLYDQGLDSGINEGANFFGNIKVADSGDDILEFLGKFLGVKEIAVHSAVDTSGVSLKLVLEAAIQRDLPPLIDTDFFKLFFTRTDIGLEVETEKVTLALSNDLVVRFKDLSGDGYTHLVFTGGVKVDTSTAITLSLTMNGTGRSTDGALSGKVQNTDVWKNPFGIPGVTLRQLAVQVGFNPEAVIDNLGLHGNLKIGDVDGSLSILVDDTNPDEFIFAGTVKKMTLLEIMSAMTPTTFAAYQALPSSVTDPLDEIVDVKVNDVKVSIVPKPASIGGVHFRDAGVTVMGKLTAWGWHASLYIVVDYKDGIIAKVDMDPLDLLGILKITGAQGDPAPTAYCTAWA